MMKRIVTLLLLLSLLGAGILTFSGCEKDLPSEELLKAAVGQLIPGSEVINRILFEEDFPTAEHGVTNGPYREADLSFLQPYDLSSLDDIRKYAEKVYSAGAVAQLFRAAVDPQTDAAGGLTRPTYLYDSNGMLMVSDEGRHVRCDKASYDLSTLSVLTREKTRATLSVTATVTNEDGLTQTRQKRLTLVLENGGWRLDNLTCLTYHATSSDGKK